jgi:hypothetical protein
MYPRFLKEATEQAKEANQANQSPSESNKAQKKKKKKTGPCARMSHLPNLNIVREGSGVFRASLI